MKKVELEEMVNHLERGIRLIGDDLEEAKRLKQEIKDIKAEIKAIKIFLSRVNPDFKSQYPEIVRKLKG